MRFKTSLIILLVLLARLFANQSYNLTGQVTSADDHQPLAGANVSLAGTSIGVTSNAQGRFQINDLPQGSYIVQVNYVGYSARQQKVDIPTEKPLLISLNGEILSGPVVAVTATQARERVNAVTFSQIDKDKMRARYTTQDVPEMLSEMPSTTFYSETGNGVGYNYLSIRGFGQRRISVLINGIPQNDPEDHNTYWTNFPDFTANVQQIQVQRGAGSAFYGPAAIGGSINILTNYFSPQPKFTAYLGGGAYNTRKMSAAYNSGLLFDKLVLYGRLSNVKSDGYRDRGWVNFWSYFAGAAYYTENQNLRLHFYGGPVEDGLIYTGLPKIVNNDKNLRRKNYTWWEFAGDVESADSLIGYDRRRDEKENFDQPHLELLHEYKLSKQSTINNALFFIRGYGFFDYDGSWTGWYPDAQKYFRFAENGFSDTLAIPSDALIRAYVDNRQVGWLPQFSWRDGNDEFVFGAELRAHRSLHWGRLQKGSGLPDALVGNGAKRYYEYKGAKNVASVYIHQTREIWPELIITADLQYAYKQYHLYDEKFLDNDFTIDYNFLNPRIGINYNISPTSNAYISMSHTSREPRLKNYYDAAEASTPASWGSNVLPQFELNDAGGYNFNKPLVKPESLDGLELGYTYRSQKLQGFINLYYMRFSDEIVKKGALDRFGQPVTGNAESTLHSGLEIGGKFQFLPAWSVSGNLSYSDNRLLTYSVYDGDGNEIVLDGNRIAGFPDLLANLRLTYNWQDLFASISGRYAGKMYTDNFENEAYTLDAYSVFNLSLRWKMRKLGLPGAALQASINNLLDTKYLAHGEGDAFFPAATRNAFIGLRFEY